LIEINDFHVNLFLLTKMLHVLYSFVNELVVQEVGFQMLSAEYAVCIMKCCEHGRFNGTSLTLHSQTGLVKCQDKLLLMSAFTETIHIILVCWDTGYSITPCLDLLGLLWFCL
jgi:hypothetical protein